MSLQIGQAYQVFHSLNGMPLDNGKIYVGVAGKNPITDPIKIYYDESFTKTAANPATTINGYISRNGTPTNIYANADKCSLFVYEKNGKLVFSDLYFTGLGDSSKRKIIAENVIDESGKTQQWLNNNLIGIDGYQHLQFNNILKTDGTTQAPSLFLSNLTGKKSKSMPLYHYKSLNEIIFENSDFYFDGNGTVFEATGNRRLLTGNNTALGNFKFTLLNTVLKQQWNPDPTGGSANNNAVVFLRGLKNPKVMHNEFTTSMSVSTGVAEINSVNYPTEFAHIAFNHFKDVQKQCVEGYGSAHNVIIGNTGDVPLLNSNALRVTGAETPTPVYNKASVYVGNTFKGGQGEVSGSYEGAGISVQTRVQGLSAAANASQGFAWGMNLKGGTTLENQSRGNYVQSSAVDCDYAVYAQSPRSEHAIIAAYNFKKGGIIEATTANSANLVTGGMKYDGILVAGVDTNGEALKVINDGSQFNLLIDLRDGGQEKRNVISGKNHSGIISVINSNNGALFLYCNDSNLQIQVKDIDDTINTPVAVRVYGSNNTITVNTKGSVRFEETAANNIVFGKVGRIQALIGSKNNSFIGRADTNIGFGVAGNSYLTQYAYEETFTVGDIPANGYITKVISLTGAFTGTPVVASLSTYNANVEIYAQVSSSGSVTVKIKNTSASIINIGSTTLRVRTI